MVSMQQYRPPQSPYHRSDAGLLDFWILNKVTRIFYALKVSATNHTQIVFCQKRGLIILAIVLISALFSPIQAPLNLLSILKMKNWRYLTILTHLLVENIFQSIF